MRGGKKKKRERKGGKIEGAMQMRHAVCGANGISRPHISPRHVWPNDGGGKGKKKEEEKKREKCIGASTAAPASAIASPLYRCGHLQGKKKRKKGESFRNRRLSRRLAANRTEKGERRGKKKEEETAGFLGNLGVILPSAAIYLGRRGGRGGGKGRGLAFWDALLRKKGKEGGRRGQGGDGLHKQAAFTLSISPGKSKGRVATFILPKVSIFVLCSFYPQFPSPGKGKKKKRGRGGEGDGMDSRKRANYIFCPKFNLFFKGKGKKRGQSECRQRRSPKLKIERIPGERSVVIPLPIPFLAEERKKRRGGKS